MQRGSKRGANEDRRIAAKRRIAAPPEGYARLLFERVFREIGDLRDEVGDARTLLGADYEILDEEDSRIQVEETSERLEVVVNANWGAHFRPFDALVDPGPLARDGVTGVRLIIDHMRSIGHVESRDRPSIEKTFGSATMIVEGSHVVPWDLDVDALLALVSERAPPLMLFYAAFAQLLFLDTTSLRADARVTLRVGCEPGDEPPGWTREGEENYGGYCTVFTSVLYLGAGSSIDRHYERPSDASSSMDLET